MEAVIRRLEKSIEFLNPHLSFVNSHMVDFFTENLWNVHVPYLLREEFGRKPQIVYNVLQYFKRGCVFKDSYLNKLLVNCYHLYPAVNDSVVIDLETFSQKFSSYVGNKREIFFLRTKNTYMSGKKEHEVCLMSPVVDILSSATKSTHLVDVGDGKGYLSSYLALQRGLKVLGLDGSEVKTRSAAKRTEKLGKHLVKDKTTFAAEDFLLSKEEDHSLPNSYYQQMTAFITPESDIKTYLVQNFPHDLVYKFGIVGLHACGNLSPVSLKLFLSNCEATFLLNVGCCYHLLEEPSMFPISNFLKEKNFVLGRNARMLASQAPDRVYSSGKIPDSLMFRAVFEALLVERFPEHHPAGNHVGRIGSKCKDFADYCNKAFRKLHINSEIPSCELSDFFKNYEDRRPYLDYYFMLRISFAPIIENIILLDRLLFLHENGLNNSWIVKLFDPETSPRCYALVSTKTC